MTGNIAIIGGGPSGLMAAEYLSGAGFRVSVFDAMPSVGRKLLMAGKTGLNLTHSEDYASFVERFGESSEFLMPALEQFSPEAVRVWAEGLGSETFVGSSGRVFPKAMKASPLLRAWLARLQKRGTEFHVRHRWIGFSGERAIFETPEGPRHIAADAFLLALGGGSWPRLGSDGAWIDILATWGVDTAPLQPANCGFDVAWSDPFRERQAGKPVKSVRTRSQAGVFEGEFVITKTGVEGSLIYAHSASLRDQLATGEQTVLLIDLAPGRSLDRLSQDLGRQERKASFSTRLRKATGLSDVKIALLRECLFEQDRQDPVRLASAIKALPLPLIRPRPLAEAISSAGGVRLQALDENYMLKRRPGVFASGEMLDWEAPTGGYLLTACFATGIAAGRGIETWLKAARQQDTTPAL